QEAVRRRQGGEGHFIASLCQRDLAGGRGLFRQERRARRQPVTRSEEEDMADTSPVNGADTYGVIVVGSGAGALLSAVRTADLGARVLVLEKEDKFGGNSAYSGGGVWAPNNPDIASVGIEDSEYDAFAYLRAVIPAQQISDETIRMYIRTAPQMIKYMREVGVPY